jgi:hypothetical protein
MDLSGFINGSLDVSSRGKRRKAVELVIYTLGLVRAAEEHYLDRIPLNLQGGDAYSASENSIDSIFDAVDILSDAY